MTEPKARKAASKRKIAKVKTAAKQKAPAKRKATLTRKPQTTGAKARQPAAREIGGVIRTTVRAVGNSAGIVLTREVLRELAVERGDAVFLVPGADGSYSITTHDPVVERQLEQAELTLSRYRNTLKKLAE